MLCVQLLTSSLWDSQREGYVIQCLSELSHTLLFTVDRATNETHILDIRQTELLQMIGVALERILLVYHTNKFLFLKLFFSLSLDSIQVGADYDDR